MTNTTAIVVKSVLTLAFAICITVHGVRVPKQRFSERKESSHVNKSSVGVLEQKSFVRNINSVVVGTQISVFSNTNYGGSSFNTSAPMPNSNACVNFPSNLQGNVGSLIIRWNVEDSNPSHIICGQVRIWERPNCAESYYYFDIPGGAKSADPSNYSYPDDDYSDTTEYSGMYSVSCTAPSETIATAFPPPVPPTPQPEVGTEIEIFSDYKYGGTSFTVRAPMPNTRGCVNFPSSIQGGVYSMKLKWNVKDSNPSHIICGEIKMWEQPDCSESYYYFTIPGGYKNADPNKYNYQEGDYRDTSGYSNLYSVSCTAPAENISPASPTPFPPPPKLSPTLIPPPPPTRKSPPPPRRAPPSPPPPRGVRYTGNLFSPDPRKLSHLSSYFQHSSARYITLTNKPAWSVVTSINWAAELENWPVKDQGACASCWAYAPISAIEAAVAVTSAIHSPPSLSVQQVIDCDGAGGCAGGWPQNALEYAATNTIVNSNVYPSTPKNRSCSIPQNPQGFTVSYYEAVDFYGWFGLLLAVQQQPVIVSIDASTTEFINYSGGIFNNSNCYKNGLDHSVLLIGYDLTSFPPYWVLRNSWGTSWGELGNMRLAITGGSGICGINALPGYYPVVKQTVAGSIVDPCNLKNFGEAFLQSGIGGPGTVSPCGGYKCSKAGTSNICYCLPPFVAVKNIDGTQTCVPAKPCSFFATNPCGVGNCVDAANGNYQCLCPLGYAAGALAYNGKPTCAPASKISGPQFYTVPIGSSLTCGIISQTYGIPIIVFEAQNAKLDCRQPLPGNTKVNVTSDFSACSLPYVVNELDTCPSIAALFKIRSLNGTGSPNHDLDCSNLIPGQQVCVIRGSPPDFPLCTKAYILGSNGKKVESCQSIIAKKFKNNAAAFFKLNPGLYCDNLFARAQGTAISSAIDQVCLASTNFETVRQNCRRGKVATVKAGENCQEIAYRYFQSSLALFEKANQGIACDNKKLFVGYSFCTAN